MSTPSDKWQLDKSKKGVEREYIRKKHRMFSVI